MVSPHKLVWLPLLGVAILVASLTFLADSPAQERPKGEPVPHKKGKPAPAPKKGKAAPAPKKDKDTQAKKDKDAHAAKDKHAHHHKEKAVPVPGVGAAGVAGVGALAGRPGYLGEELKVEEAAALRKAYILLAGGNHDYDGHRVKAMHAVKEGVKLLDESIMAHGNATQKGATKQGEAAIAKADEAAKNTKMYHEPQPASDAALRDAGKLLKEAHAALVTHNRTNVMAHVDAAIKEINIALKIR